MTAQLAPVAVAKFFTNDGFPLSFGQLFTYAAGTTTPQATYIDSTQTTQNTNPIQLNFRGECNLWLDPTKSYKFLLQDLFGNTIPGWPVDNITIGSANPSFSVIPTSDNLYTLGSSSFSWANVFIGVNHAPVLDTVTGNIGYIARTTAEISGSVTPVNFSFPELDLFRYSVGNASTTNWQSVYGKEGAFQSIAALQLRLGYVRPEWFAPNGQITPAMDASPYINAAITFLNTRNSQGVTAVGFGRGVLLFDAITYVCHSTLIFGPFINYVGCRASTTDAVADFTSLASSRGTILRAHTDIYNNSNAGQGVLVYVQTGDITIEHITFVGTSQINGNPSKGIQWGSTGGGTRPFETANQLVSGIVMNECSLYTFQQAFECNWTGDSFFYQIRFETNNTNILLSGNSAVNSANELRMVSCIHFGHSTGINIQNQAAGRTWSHVFRMDGGYFYGTTSGVVHLQFVASPAPANLDLRFTDVDMTHTSTSCRFVLWNANLTGCISRLTFNGGNFVSLSATAPTWQQATSLFSFSAGATVPNNINFYGIDFLNTTLTFSNCTEYSIVGGIVDGTQIEMDTSSTNWILDHNLYRNFSGGTAINITTANCGPGKIIAPRFTGVTTPITIFSNATNATIEIIDPIGYTTTPASGTIHNLNPGVTFANLGTPSNGSVVFCSDGTAANPVAGGGTGCLAKRLNGVWVGN